MSEIKQLSYVNRCCKSSDLPEDCSFALHLVCHYDKHPWHSTHNSRSETRMLHWAVQPPHFHLASKQLITFVRGVKSVAFPFCSHAWPFQAAAEWDIFFKNHWRKNEWNCYEWKSTKSSNVAPELFRCKSDQFIPNKVNKLLERTIVLCAISLSLNLSFSLSGKQNWQKPIRLYWKRCTFFFL